MKFDCSVILCTHNPRRDYLKAALDSIRAQTLPTNQWEFLLVDNASSEQLEGRVDLSWHPNGRHIREDELGLTAARLRGILESKADSLVFVDDDNVLSPDYIAASLALLEGHQWLGVIGAGVLRPQFEKEPCSKFRRLLPLLALRNLPGAIWSNNPEDATGIPWGAGLCVRRTVALHYIDLVERLNINDSLGRRGRELTCGDDDLFSFAAIFRGMGFGVFPELQITHLISANRLSEPYFLRLLEGHGFSHAVIGHWLNTSSGRPLGLLSRLRRILSVARGGWFHVRAELAWQGGVRRAERYITERVSGPMCP